VEKADRVIKAHQRNKRDQAGGDDAEEKMGERCGLFIKEEEGEVERLNVQCIECVFQITKE
jgi:hypothetical protein